MENSKKITLHVGGKLHILNAQDILMLYARGSYTDIRFTTGKELHMARNMKSILSQLDNTDTLLRVHRSYCVNKELVSAAYRRNNKVFLMLNNEVEVPVTVCGLRTISSLLNPKN